MKSLNVSANSCCGHAFNFHFLSKVKGLPLPAMKILSFIMASLVLALSVIPCADNGVAANDGKAKTEFAKSNTQKGTTEQDDCSPFCTCNCCAGFAINHFVASITIIPQFSSKPLIADLPAEVIEISLPIWQPPQIV